MEWETTLIVGQCVYYLLDIVVGECAAVFELFAGEDQALLVGWNALFVLDLALDIVDCVRGLDLEGDGLAREGFDEAVGNRGQKPAGLKWRGSKGDVGSSFTERLTSALLVEAFVSKDQNRGKTCDTELTLCCGSSSNVLALAKAVGGRQ